MIEEPLNDIYYSLYLYLKEWVSNNEKLQNNITPNNLKYLFEFDNKRGLTIDLCRFNKEYYYNVFAYASGSKMVEEFIRKVCLLMRDCLVKLKQPDLTITITVKSNVSIKTLYQKYHIHPKFTGANVPHLIEHKGHE